ncbi:hypothetical protein [Enterococcus sp. BWR-S5]|uniref:hypothetical protein n=1 Tax=Enterococcus sp. BWR-S5 TaxID=2787714 RepID=UPI001921638B|nr:hypothetical protein [Enterococcus sp. BWR-S5]MBL1225718.1 hypothetical protein [Enterococcus sp. BWR-S5]
MPKLKERRNLNDQFVDKLLWKARQSKFYQYSFKRIYTVASEKGRWDMRRTQNELDYQLCEEMMLGKQKFFEQGYSIFNNGYELFLLNDTPESQKEMDNIVSNARSRTMKAYVHEEEGKKDKNKKEIEKKFEKKYNYLSEENKTAIKKGRKSGINRYKNPVTFVKLGENQNYLKDNTADCQADMELKELVMNELTTEEKKFLADLMVLTEEEIAVKRNIQIDSVKRKERRLRDKMKILLKNSA